MFDNLISKVIIFLMMSRYLHKLIFLFLVLSVSESAGAQGYLWPMQGNRRLSSTFLEFREGHLHAGIDIRSFGELGLPCFAVREGYVERVKVQPYGYGKALYLRLDDGNIAVYAHLYGFSAVIDSLVYARRMATHNSWCDIRLPEGKYRYRRGETLAYTGQTGTRAPHLHFELRDRRGRPFNPLMETYSVPDNIPPVISSLEVAPLSPGSRVNGQLLSSVFSFERRAGGVYRLADTLQLSGSFGFGVSAWDRQAAGVYRMEPFSMEVMVDGDTLYRLENRIFSYYQSGDVRFEFNDYNSGWSRRFKNLYRKEGNSLPHRSGPGTVSGAGVSGEGISLNKSLHRADLRVRDIAGNISRAYFYFRIHSYPEVMNLRKLANSDEVIISSADPDGGKVRENLFESLDGGVTWKELGVEKIGSYTRAAVTPNRYSAYKYEIIDDEGMELSGTFAAKAERPGEDMVFSDCSLILAAGSVILDIKTDRILSSPPSVEAYPGILPEEIVQTGEKRYSARFGIGSLSDGENLFRVRGLDYRGFELEDFTAAGILFFRSGSDLEWPASDTLGLRFSSPSVSGSAPCVISPPDAAVRVDSAMVPVISPFRLDFQEGAFLEPLVISADAGGRVGLYKYDPDDSSWSCRGPAGAEGGISITRAGIYALFRDGLPPRIGKVAISEKPAGSGFFRNYSYSIPIADDESGIDPYSAEVFWNGKWVVSVWDDIRERLFIPVPSTNMDREISLKVGISDKIGNRSVENFSFVIE